ncbi:hypothetical protein NL299_26245, partial [Klebsiella pneumoniae]|nr:hypothetical protein [Klebsiella pneumoniae]
TDAVKLYWSMTVRIRLFAHDIEQVFQFFSPCVVEIFTQQLGHKYCFLTELGIPRIPLNPPLLRGEAPLYQRGVWGDLMEILSHHFSVQC